MRYIDPHQTYEVNRRHIISPTFPVLTVIGAACITHATLEPMVFMVTLHLHDEHDT